MPVRNAAGTSRSAPRRSRSAPTSTAAGSCQLGPPRPSAPTTIVRDGSSSAIAAKSSSSSSSAGYGSAPSSSIRSAAFSSSIWTTRGAGASCPHRRQSPRSAPRPPRAPRRTAAPPPRALGGPLVLRGRPGEEVALVVVGALHLAGAPTTARRSSSLAAGVPRAPGRRARATRCRTSRSSSSSSSSNVRSVSGDSSAAGGTVTTGSGSLRTVTCSSPVRLGGRTRRSSGSSHSTSLIGAKNLSRSSNRSSLSRSSSGTRPP